MGERGPNVRLRKTCDAPPEAVYDLLVDLRSHALWGGARQRGNFRLLSLSAPAGPAEVGTVFTSTGAIPMSARRWNDRSTVTVATRPTTLEFVTEARAENKRSAMTARYVHRYNIAPDGRGSRVTYTLTEERIAAPMLRFGLPVVRAMTWSMAAFMLARGFRNLLQEATSRYARMQRQETEASSSARRQVEV